MATESILRPGELKEILLREIEAANLSQADTAEVGTTLEVRDGVARIYGLKRALAGEMLEFTSSETGEVISGLVLNLEQDNVGAAIMGDYLKLKEGDEVRSTGHLLDRFAFGGQRGEQQGGLIIGPLATHHAVDGVRCLLE